MTVATPLPLADPTANVTEKVQAVLDQKADIDAWVGTAAAREAGITNVYLVGCGGSLFNFTPLHYFLDTHAGVPVFLINAAEFSNRKPSQLGPGSVVIASSTRGNTPETAEAAAFAASMGAAVIAVTQNAESIVGEAASAAPGGTVVVHDGPEAKAVAQALLGFALASATGSASTFESELAALTTFGDVVTATVEEIASLTDRLATEQARNKEGLYIVGAGSQTGAASTLAMCYLQEMQWLPASAFDAGDYLHGAMEVVVKGTPVVVFIDETAVRPLAERVASFVDRFSGNGYVYDSSAFSFPGVDASARPFVSSWIFHAAVVGRIAQYFESNTGQPLTTRRYMWKEQY